MIFFTVRLHQVGEEMGEDWYCGSGPEWSLARRVKSVEGSKCWRSSSTSPRFQVTFVLQMRIFVIVTGSTWHKHPSQHRFRFSGIILGPGPHVVLSWPHPGSLPWESSHFGSGWSLQCMGRAAGHRKYAAWILTRICWWWNEDGFPRILWFCIISSPFPLVIFKVCSGPVDWWSLWGYSIQYNGKYLLVKQHSYGKSQIIRGKSSILGSIFQSYVKLPESITIYVIALESVRCLEQEAHDVCFVRPPACNSKFYGMTWFQHVLAADFQGHEIIWYLSDIQILVQLWAPPSQTWNAWRDTFGKVLTLERALTHRFGTRLIIMIIITINNHIYLTSSSSSPSPSSSSSSWSSWSWSWVSSSPSLSTIIYIYIHIFLFTYIYIYIHI